MVRHFRLLGCLGVALCLLASVARGQPVPPSSDGLVAADPAPPTVGIHAHNDYERDRPLVAALDAGAASIEADVHAVGGRLLVAHDRDEVRPGRTLESLYLRPLWQRYWRLGGVVRAGQRRPLILMVDFKTTADTTWPLLAELLDRYRPMLTAWQGGRERPGAVIIAEDITTRFLNVMALMSGVTGSRL